MHRLVIPWLIAACSDRASEELAAKLESAQRENAQLRAQLAAKQAEVDGTRIPAVDRASDAPAIHVRVGPQTFEIDGTQLAETELARRFRAAFESNRRTQLIIHQDKGVVHGRVVTVLEAAKAAGLTRFALE